MTDFCSLLFLNTFLKHAVKTLHTALIFLLLTLPHKSICTYFPLAEGLFLFVHKVSCIFLFLSFTGLFKEPLSEPLLHAPLTHVACPPVTCGSVLLP